MRQVALCTQSRTWLKRLSSSSSSRSSGWPTQQQPPHWVWALVCLPYFSSPISWPCWHLVHLAHLLFSPRIAFSEDVWSHVHSIWPWFLLWLPPAHPQLPSSALGLTLLSVSLFFSVGHHRAPWKVHKVRETRGAWTGEHLFAWMQLWGGGRVGHWAATCMCHKAQKFLFYFKRLTLKGSTWVSLLWEIFLH